ncbi:RHS repeat-associated core domain-containing protein [Nocardioides jishulii]|nr:RHS repeat-associated core domain-containing protein [Nocardioides jishulii]
MLDGLGSVTGTLDASGGVASSSAYSVFGQPAGTGAVGLGDAFGYTGHAWDGDAGMHFARARWYDAGVGRFASEDPVDAMNLYPYVGNQPMDWVDPTGRMAFSYAGFLDNGMRIVGSVGAWFVMYFTSGVMAAHSFLKHFPNDDRLGGCAGNDYLSGVAWSALHVQAVMILMAAPTQRGAVIFGMSKWLMAEFVLAVATTLNGLRTRCVDL